jgi:hypothetical protein
MFEPAVAKAIQQFSDGLSDKFPEIGVVIHALKEGDIGEVEAMARLMDIVAQQGIGSDIERVAEEAFAATKEASTKIVPVIDGPTPAIVHRGTSGLPMLNPLLEAAITERVQFDGDAPELRSGPIIPGVMPAVPVETTARDLVTIGVQLQQASEEVKAELDIQEQQFGDKVNALFDDAQTVGMTYTAALQVIQDRQLPVPTGVPGYEAGKLPAVRDVGTPTGSALAALSIEDQQQAAWHALSTTQGRRSAVAVLEELIVVGLKGDGYNLPTRSMGNRVNSVPVYAHWTVNMSGAESTQSNFSFIDTAARSLCRQLKEQLDRVEVPNPVLEVFPINTVDIRKVGWAARVVSQ